MEFQPYTPIPRKRSMGTADRFFAYLRALSASDALLMGLAIVASLVSLSWLLITASKDAQVEIASSGGSLTEGIIGTPRFINPVLAVTRADKDLTTLVYDGLMRLKPDGTLAPSVAESITVSEDGLTYNVVLKHGITFHDGTPLTALDVVYTVGRIQEAVLTSPLRASFDGISVEQVGEYELNFVLPEPYSPFIENLTFGILPQHIWKGVSNEEFPFSQRNSDPIGSGPYRIKNIQRTASGIPASYELAPFTEYHEDAPKIEQLTLTFFANDEKLVQAFRDGTIDSVAGIDQTQLFNMGINTETHTVLEIPLPRTFALFINQNKSPALSDLGARKALDAAIDRGALIETVLGGYGIALYSPIPTGFGIESAPENMTAYSLEDARETLRDSGWKLNPETGMWEKKIDGVVTPLSFSIATVNSPVFEATAEFLRASWEALGVPVTIKQFEQSDLTQSIIRPRDYEALLFGMQVGRSLDFYSFWHSSQRNDPGLNVSLYTNLVTDSLLSTSRTDTHADVRADALTKFGAEIAKETPAIFLYQPELLYVFPNRVKHASFARVSEPQERWSGIYEWYIDTDSIWPIFRKQEEHTETP